MSKKSRLSVEPYKGVRDFYPEDQALLRHITDTQRLVVERFGYEEYHASILEPAELYQEKTNDEIVTEQVYTFTDRGGREVTLRPEMTPTVARMVASRRRDMGFPLRLYSIPNVFRYERPQRGRLREHWQLNVDLLGSKDRNADAEIIAIAHAVMLAFGAKETDFTVQIGSRTFLNQVVKDLGLSEDRAKALRSLLDRREKMPAEEFEMALDALGASSELFSPTDIPEDVRAVLEILLQQGITNAQFAPHIVRGFDYYTGIVFEIFDTHPDNTRSLFGGGRYDNLLQYFDSEEVPAVGFGMGDVTIENFLETHGLLPAYTPHTKVYIAVVSPNEITVAQKIASMLRTSGVNTAIDFGEKKLADQLHAAHKHKIPYVIVIGEKEVASKVFTVRNLESGEEQSVEQDSLVAFFK